MPWSDWSLGVVVENVHLRSGGTIHIDDGVTVFVGPNNVGKSALLRDLAAMLATEGGAQVNPGTVLEGLDLHWDSSREEQLEAFRSAFRYYPIGTPTALAGYGESMYRLSNDQLIHESTLTRTLTSGSLGPLAATYCLHFVAENRTSMVGPDPAFDAVNGVPSSPLQMLWANRELEAELSEAVRESFGSGITLNRYAGANIPLHYGSPTAPETAPPLSAQYVDQLRALPQVVEQGDGMRSFIGLALNILAGSHRLVLLDEPEAFLHPPQARNLGRLLVKFCQAGARILVATHSDDIVQGIASAARDTTPVAVHRITRAANKNHVSSISTEAVRDLYADPFMRYSSVLDGLFYHGVALCESFGDCTYYRSVLDGLPRTTPHVDIHFSQTGGKQRIASAARSLRSAAVPVASIVDIDMLSDQVELQTLVEAHSGDINLFTTRLNTVRAAVRSKGEEVARSDFAAAAEPIIRAAEPTHLTRDEIASARASLQARSGWRQLKVSGTRLLNGQALSDLLSIMDDLANLGIFVVPVGELESFHPTIGSRDKMQWLREVLAGDLQLTQGEHRDFVVRFRDYIATNQLDPPASLQRSPGPLSP